MKRFFGHPLAYPLGTTVLFALAIVAGVLPASVKMLADTGWWGFIPKTLLALGFLALAAWFLHAFTQPDQTDADAACNAEQRASMFRFAYLFSIYSFALLVLPFTAMLRDETPPDAGPIRLLRACVQPQAVAKPASGVTGPVETCPADGMPAPHTLTYPWLVSVGGVVAHRCGNNGFDCVKSSEPAASGAAAAASAPAAKPDKPELYSVRGGLVVPFYVIVFSFVGGVVNLTRRVPEYQKRSACSFAGTPTEPKVSLLEAREFIIFQLMQLLSSPFVAMVAYYALEPKSIASAVGVAFFSGFATESVLLLIRGMISGLKPETTKTVASGSSATAQLHVVINRAAGAPVNGTKVELRRLPTASPPIESKVCDVSGQMEFKGLAAGTVWVVATLDLPAAVPAQLTASQKVQLVSGQTESITLVL